MHSVSTMTRAMALVCLAAPLWTPGVPAQEAGNPRDIAVTLSAPSIYVPGMEMELTVRITAGVAVEPEGENPVDPVLALGLQVGIPDEWAYASWGELVSGTDPAIKPQAGATGALDFAWIMSAEAFPHEFRFTVLAAADASGPMTFSARALPPQRSGISERRLHTHRAHRAGRGHGAADHHADWRRYRGH